MRILIINKFLHPNGGAETYVFELGKYLQQRGHAVEYFGMDHAGRCVGNRVGAYTSEMDFHGKLNFSALTYPFKTIYSSEARQKLRLVLDDFRPDIVHLNNFNYQLTPSIILELAAWRKRTGRACKIILTAHDYQLVCPNHQLHDPNTHQNCEKCLDGHFFNCVKCRCIHGSAVKSLIGAVESTFWHRAGVYRYIDNIICCSRFLKDKLDTNLLFAEKTVLLPNFVVPVPKLPPQNGEYVLYFGRYSKEKGLCTLAKACELLPEIPFVFAGAGPLENVVNSLPNATNVGFHTGDTLDKLIRKARFSICPSEVYENCPFSVLESQQRGTPVIGANIGGIPELIADKINGRLFESKNHLELADIIRELWDAPETVQLYSENCLHIQRDDLSAYYEKLMGIYAK